MSGAKKRLLYWVVEGVSPRHRHLAGILSARGFEVSFQTSVASLMQASVERRSGAILIDDEGARQTVEKNLISIMNAPEFQGARIILSTGNRYSDTLQLASWGNFRDILPLDLDDQTWLRRFLYATASKAAEYPQPLPQLTLNNFAQVAIPARISWITEEKICIESRSAPSIGTTLHMHGRLAASLGTPSLSVTVESLQRSNLLYRFSEAIIGSWSVPEKLHDRKQTFMTALRAKNPTPRIRVFAAIHNAAMRHHIIERLSEPKFEVKTALQKQAIIDEPRFFSPDLIFLEDTLFQEDQGSRFRMMLKGLQQRLAIVVVGQSVPREILKDMASEHRIIVIPRLPKDLADAVMRRFLGANHRLHNRENSNIIQLAPIDALTFAEIYLPARVSSLHPEFVKVQTQFPIGNFGLLRIESPLFAKVLTHPVYAKVTSGKYEDSSANSQFVYGISCNLSNVGKTAKAQLAKFLAASFAANMAQLEKLDGTLASEEPVGAPFMAEPDAERKLIDAIHAAATVPQTVDVPKPKVVKEQQPSPPVVPERHAPPAKPFWTEIVAALQTPGLKYFALFVAFCSFVGVALWLIVTVVAPEWHKSGSQYSDTLKKMYPPNDSQTGH